jgi:hypothetical protein
VRGLAEGLFDDAALFPPGNAPMAVAVPAHRELRAQLGSLVGPFVLPVTRLGELTTHLDDGPVLEVSLIAAPSDLADAVAQVAASPGLQLAAVEMPVVPDAEAAREAVRALDVTLQNTAMAAVELPRTDSRDEVLDVLRHTRYRAKLRTGGVRADLFPTPAELAATLAACVERGVGVKCTAGLHHAVRHTDPATGFEHHGFVNVLIAADALVLGSKPAVAADWLAEIDAGVLTGALRVWSPERLARARSVFTSFGTCSVLEPVEDLVALGLLPAVERTYA